LIDYQRLDLASGQAHATGLPGIALVVERPADIVAIADLAMDRDQRFSPVIEQLAGKDAGMSDAGARSRSPAILAQLPLGRVPHLLFDDPGVQAGKPRLRRSMRASTICLTASKPIAPIWISPAMGPSFSGGQ